MKKCYFENNIAYIGGAISAQQYNYLLIDDRTIFKQNVAMMYGDDVFSTQSDDNVNDLTHPLIKS